MDDNCLDVLDPDGDENGQSIRQKPETSPESQINLIRQYCAAGFFLVHVPSIDGKPTKGPRCRGWNRPYDPITNPNGFTNDAEIAVTRYKSDPNANVGVALLPSKLCVLDIDHVELATPILLDYFGFGNWALQDAMVEIVSGKPNRRKFIFRIPEGASLIHWKLQFRDPKDPKSFQVILELRCMKATGATQQDLVPPSVHPETGRPYQWNGDFESVPPLPNRVREIWDNISEWKELLKSEDPLWQPPPECSDFKKKADQFVDGQRSPINEYNETHCIEDLLREQGYSQVGRQYLRPGSTTQVPGLKVFVGDNGKKLAYSFGGDTLNDGHAHDVFDFYRILECEGDWAKALGWNPEISEHNRKLLPKQQKKRLNARLEEFNKYHGVVHSGGKTRIVRRVYSHVYRTFIYELSSVRSMEEYYRNETTSSSGKAIQFFTVWMKWNQRRTYSRVIFEPTPGLFAWNNAELPNGDVFNFYLGLQIRPQSGRCERIINHIYEVWCDGNSVLFEYVLSWLARMVQKPHLPAETALVLHSKEGTGKNAIGKVLKGYFGPHAFELTQQGQLVGRFSGHLEHNVVVIGNEALWGGNRSQEGVLKALITDEHRVMERKQLDAIQVGNFTHAIFLTNNDWAVPASLDDRRFVVLDVSDKFAKHFVYFSKLVREIENGGAAAFLAFLLNRDISDFNHRRLPDVKSAYKRELKLNTAKAHVRWLDEALAEGGFHMEVEQDHIRKEDWEVGYDLRMMSVSNDKERQKMVQKFQSEFESKRKECAVLIVSSTIAPDKWTIAGFNDEGQFKSVLIDDSSNELAVELKKKSGRESNILSLATSSLGRTRTREDKAHAYDKDMLYTSYILFCRRMVAFRETPLQKNKLMGLLIQLFKGESVRQTSCGKRVYRLQLPNLEEARKRFETWLGGG